MPWPKGKTRAKKQSAAVAVADPVAIFTEYVESPYTLKTKLALRVDKIMNGPFAGLYQLTTIDREGNEKIAVPPTTIRFIILGMHKQLMGVD